MGTPDSSTATAVLSAAPEPSPFVQMMRAVDDEIEAVRRKSRASIITVTNGRRITQGDEVVAYRFAIRRGMTLRDDTRAECELDGEVADGTVLSARDGELLLSVRRDMGPAIATGKLVLDNVWLLTALRERLQELEATHRAGALAAVDRMLGRSPIRSGHVAPPTPSPIPGRRVLREQQLAVGKALGSDTLYLWGPAGTGKSTTVADIVAALVRTDSTLVVAHTNDAVDGALLKIVERLSGDPALAAGQVVRLGPIVNEELRSRFGNLVSFDAVVARRQEEIGSRIDAARAGIESLEAEQEQLRRTLRHPEIGTASALGTGARAATRSRLAAVQTRLEQLQAEVRVLRRRFDTAAADVMKGCRILATTVHRAYLPGQVDRTFDTVVIDEAGAVMLPMAVTAAARATRRIVCAGDFRQLGAPVHAKASTARRWLARDVFEVAGIPQLIERGRQPSHLVTLRWQFRMAPDVAWLVNDLVYGGILLDDPSVLARPGGPLGDQALVFVDTSRLSPRTIKRDSGTRTNALHAFIARALVERLARKGLLTRAPGARDPVGVVSPYRGQIELIRRHLSRVPGAGATEVSTVHRLQGGERDIIIADLTDSVGPALGHFMRARRLHEESAKLMNVMFTRARLHLVVIANFEHLLATAPRDGLLRQFLLRIRRRGRSVDPKALLCRTAARA